MMAGTRDQSGKIIDVLETVVTMPQLLHDARLGKHTQAGKKAKQTERYDDKHIGMNR